MIGRIGTTGLMVLVTGLGGLAIAEEPDPNPAPQPDGTNVWYVGNNTQYPVIQEVLDACGDGDEIVVAEGLYVESLEIVRNDVTLRPWCMPPNGTTPVAHWADVIFWNPTEGFNNANGYAIRMTGGNNTYVGRPRQVTELDNTYYQIPTEVQPGEFNAVGAPVDVSVIAAATDLFLNRGAMTFWSRSINNVAVYSTNGEGTFQDCSITSQNGFGGGAIITGSANTTQFVNCNFNSTFATGNPLKLSDGTFGPEVNVVTITGGAPQFMDCRFTNNQAGTFGIIYDVDSQSHWDRCEFQGNMAPASNGAFYAVGSTPTFMRSTFEGNSSLRGTVFWDSTGVTGPNMMNFNNCNFVNCTTADLMYGGAVMVDCDDCEGSSPLVMLSQCGFRGNQGRANSTGWDQYDIWSPYFPKFRIGADLDLAKPVVISDVDEQSLPGDVNGDGVVDFADIESLHASLGSCRYDGNYDGDITIDDLLGVLAAYGAPCQ